MTESTLSIAGINLTFLYDEDLPEPDFEEGPDPVEGADHIRFHVHRGPLPDMGSREVIFDSGEAWALFRSGYKYVLQNNSLGPESSPDVFVVLNSNLISGHIYLNYDPSFKREPSDPLGWPLNQILMIFLLSIHRGILFHACGIDDRGEGLLFLGNSGHGKTTMARLWKNTESSVLNDDRIVVREKGNRFWMFGTPWHGDLATWSSRGVPIHRIFFLKAGEKNAVVPKTGAEAVSMLIARSFPPFWDRKNMAYTVDLCHRLVKKIPCHELRFARDRGVVDFIRGLSDLS